jgi:monofunctional biosynthetic peptidoglycan transglycosylase
MSDERGPPTGPGDELPDVAPRTGPPAEPVVASASVPVATPAAETSAPEALPEAGPPADDIALLDPAEDVAAPPAIEPLAEPITGLQEIAVLAREEITTEARNLVHAPESGWSTVDLEALFASEAIGEPEIVARSEPWTAPPEAEALPDTPPVLPDAEEQIAESEVTLATAAASSVTAAEPFVDLPIQEATETVADTAAVESLSADTLEAEPVVEPSDAPERTAASIKATDPAVEPAAPSPAQPPPISSALVPPLPIPVPAARLSSIQAPAEILSPPPPPIAVPASRSVWPRRFRRAAFILVGLAVGYAVLVLTLIVAYRWVDPPRSALMIATRLSGQPVVYGPVPITSISSYLQRAVVTSEDARFCYHRGVDWAALYEAMNESRGGSTITMQVAKNLFLWPSRSYVRKAIEIPVALTIDAVWSKRRVLEVYLNIAEWGPGIFGAEAASYYHFDKPASRLTTQEAALLAASLPNPIARDAGEPGRITALLASRLRGRMTNSDAFVSCLGLRPVPRAEPKAPPRPANRPAARPSTEQRPTTKAEPQLKPWQTTTEPAFNPWQN